MCDPHCSGDLGPVTTLAFFLLATAWVCTQESVLISSQHWSTDKARLAPKGGVSEARFRRRTNCPRLRLTTVGLHNILWSSRGPGGERSSSGNCFFCVFVMVAFRRMPAPAQLFWRAEENLRRFQGEDRSGTVQESFGNL